MAATPNTPIQEVFRQRPEGGEFSPLCSEGEEKNPRGVSQRRGHEALPLPLGSAGAERTGDSMRLLLGLPPELSGSLFPVDLHSRPLPPSFPSHKLGPSLGFLPTQALRR